MEGVHVLLVDDERGFVETLAGRLALRGCRITSALDGRQALEALTDRPGIEVVVLDLQMPGTDGIEILKAIKERNPLVEVIFLTGQSSLATALAAMKRGAFDYLEKPYDPDSLAVLIARAVARKRYFEDKIREVRIIPYISDRERQRLLDEIKETAARRNTP